MMVVLTGNVMELGDDKLHDTTGAVNDIVQK